MPADNASAPGRTIAIGDIHGCHIALETILEALDPQPADCLVFLGDVIDRGPGTKQCIDQLLALRPCCRVVHLMGNHEEMFLDALTGGQWSQSWLAYGGQEMLHSYGGGIRNIPLAHLDFIRGGKDFFETEREIFVHGNLRPQVPVDQEQSQWLRWARFQPTDQTHVSGKRVICGHTAQPGGRPVGGANYLCLDTCAYCPRGALSALDVATDTLWQATQAGELRDARPLADLLQ
jgi:serine/threonine protein phosphatase 1